jgi:heme-binding NEAT domain protein
MTRMTDSKPASAAQGAEPSRDQNTDTGATESETSRPQTTPDGKVRYNPAEAGEYGVAPSSDEVYQPGDDEDGDGS